MSTASLRRVVVGTAGHVDHGKTRLVEALTGVDCDRWEEEKRRGITIDLGFAHFVEGDLQVGFVDVPGHQKFLHNALAGLGGIRLVLLVVAADEGIQPQTREHLAVCELLGIPKALVALTKSDRVGEEVLTKRRQEVRALLAGTPFAGASLVPVSTVSGDGLEELRRELVELGGRHAHEPDPRPARLPVDRAFKLKGHGAIVTGTLAAGSVVRDQRLAALPGDGEVRVRNLQVHGEDRETAEAGERVAVQLSGADSGALARGNQLVAAGAYGESRRWLTRFELLDVAPKPLAGAVGVKVFLLSSEVNGRIRSLDGRLAPGSTGIAEIRLAEPVAAVRGDRFVVRRPSPPLTIGGGMLLDPEWRSPGGPARSKAVDALSGDTADAVGGWLELAGERGLDRTTLSRRLGIAAAGAEALLTAAVEGQQAVKISAPSGDGDRWFAPRALQRIEERARDVLEGYFAAHRMKEAMPRAEAVAAILPGRLAEQATAHLEWLAARKALVVDGDRVLAPGRGPRLSDTESKLATAILGAFESAGLTPPSPGEIRTALGAKAQILEGVTSHLLEKGRLTRLPGGLLVATSAIEKLRTALLEGPDEFGVGDFKSRFGLTRKWAIPLLEHLDGVGATRRVGDRRQVVR